MSEEKKEIKIDDALYETEIPESFFESGKRIAKSSREIRAFIPGTIAEIKVREGEKVSSEQVIIVLEAMKMLNDVEAGIEGRIAEIKVSVGERVEKGQVMAIVEE